MTIYETIKVAISVKQAAEHYGLKVNRNGMACCPFHNDRHPSMKLNEDYFFCFGCGVKGDVIDFVARSFDLSSYEAAQKLASDFGLDPKPPTSAAMLKPKRPYIRQFREDEMLCFRVLYYRTRFQIEFCFRDAKGYTGLMDCQARDKWKLDFAFNASFTSLNVAKVTMKEMGMEYSMSSLKSLMTNIYLVKRIFKASGYTPNRTLISKIFKDLSCLQRIAA